MAELMIKKWGGGLAVRIPKAIADRAKLKEDQRVSIEAKNGQIIIAPVQVQREYFLDELLSQCSARAVSLDREDGEWLNGEAVGREW